MSLAIAGSGAVQPIYAPGPVPPYAQNQSATESVAATIAGAEGGASSVVYEPGASETEQQLTYSNREQANRAAALAAAAASANAPAASGDEAVVAATDGGVLPPPQVPETPHAAEVREMLHNVWAPMRPVMADPVMGTAAASAAPVQANSAEASAQASYAAVVDAMIAGAPLSDLEKFA
ncbi:MAG: hypothetical protein J7494_07875 [Sphingobium sp.]|nr:hypothetical protein [Sphingobium sp.]